MNIQALFKFIAEWQYQINGMTLDIEGNIDNVCVNPRITELYDLYYKAVSDLKRDIYGNQVDEVEMLDNGSIKFIKYDPLTFEI